MDQATANFVLVLAGFVIEILLGIAAYFIRRELSRVSECAAHLEKDQRTDSQNLEDWKLTYVRGHAEVEGKISVLQASCGEGVKQLQIDARALLIAQATLTAQMHTLERLIRMDSERRDGERDRRDR